MIKNIIFDWDNTLFPFKKVYWGKAHRALFQADFELSDEKLEQLMVVFQTYDESLWENVSSNQMTIETFRDERLRLTLLELELTVDETYISTFNERFIQTMHQIIKPEVRLIDCLADLAKNYQLAILSNGASIEQRGKLIASQIDQLYPIYISGETGYLKPDSQAFEYLLEQEKFKAEETLMVGDLLEHDILPAQKLGMKTVYIGAGPPNEADFSYENIEQFFENWLP